MSLIGRQIALQFQSVYTLCLQICPSLPTFVSDVVFITSFHVSSGYIYVSHIAKFHKFRHTAPLNSLLKALTPGGKKLLPVNVLDVSDVLA